MDSGGGRNTVRADCHQVSYQKQPLASGSNSATSCSSRLGAGQMERLDLLARFARPNRPAITGSVRSFAVARFVCRQIWGRISRNVVLNGVSLSGQGGLRIEMMRRLRRNHAMRCPIKALRNVFRMSGWEAGIRTPIRRSRVCSPTVRRPPNKLQYQNFIQPASWWQGSFALKLLGPNPAKFYVIENNIVI